MSRSTIRVKNRDKIGLNLRVNLSTKYMKLNIQIIKKPLSDTSRLKIRFHSTWKEIEKTSEYELIQFKMKPSDPDFPFDLDYLDLELKVTSDGSSCCLRVLNEDIPLELRLNIENAWILESRLNIFDRIKWLDRQLESLLILPCPSTPYDVSQDLSYATSNHVKDEKEENGIKFIPFQHITLDSSHQDQEDKESDIKQELIETLTLQDKDQIVQKGIQIKLQIISLKNISLAQCTTLNISLKCNRCRGIVDLSLTQQETWKSCSTCNQSLGAKFTKEFILADANILGYIDVSDGIQIADILASAFSLLCEQGHEIKISSVQMCGITRLNCHQCHMIMVLELDGFKSMRIGHSSLLVPKNNGEMKRKQKREISQITKGSNLPLNGSCEHYKKSYRWLRFPCCGKSFPCDICHDLASKNPHDIKWAHGMICGFCSNEQSVNEKCHSCGKELTKNASGGYWEGGKGTRDRIKMSRRDSHKFKGTNKTVSQKSARVGKLNK